MYEFSPKMYPFLLRVHSPSHFFNFYHCLFHITSSSHSNLSQNLHATSHQHLPSAQVSMTTTTQLPCTCTHLTPNFTPIILLISHHCWPPLPLIRNRPTQMGIPYVLLSWIVIWWEFIIHSTPTAMIPGKYQRFWKMKLGVSAQHPKLSYWWIPIDKKFRI